MITLALLLACVNGQPAAAVNAETHRIDLTICGSDEKLVTHSVEFIIDRPGAADVDISVDKRWSLRLKAKDLAGINAIRAPEGVREMKVHSAHYRDATAALGPKRATVVLHRMPVIRGRVLVADGQPLAGTIVDPLSCVTKSDGTFSCEVEADWPRAIRIATHIVPLDRSEHDTNLGDIRLAKGARLAVHIEGPDSIRDAGVILFRDDVQLAERHLRPSEPVEFSNVEPGEVRVLVKGARPLEQRGETLEIKAGDNEQKISIEPSELTLRVRSGTRAEQGASVTMKSVDGQWIGRLTTDETGTIVEPMWQLGSFTAAVQPKAAVSPVLDHHEFTDGEKQQWTFQLPIGRIEGIVQNEKREPVAGAEVGLTSDDGDMATALHTQSDANGHYAFDGVRAGAQSLTASADGYLPSEAIEFKLVENEEPRRADLTLHSGKQIGLDIVDRRGVPLAGAAIIAAVDNAISTRSATDGNGHAIVQVPLSGSAVLFVVPASGSFAVHRVTGVDRDAGSIRIGVPDAAASLELKTETTEHKPVPEIRFLVRYDGELMPIEVPGFPPFATGADGSGRITDLPLGTYELWPAVGAIDLEMSDVPPPLRIALAPGENSATLTFRTKRQ